MMYRLILISFLAFVFVSCNSSTESTVVNEPQKATQDSIPENFFPVTSYLQGQVYEIRQLSVNPLMYITRNNVTDSSWVKMEQLDSVFAPFMHPVIDSINWKHLFTEEKFLDQTVNAYTFTYDPAGILPDSVSLRHWDLYVDPNTNQVRRVYIVKEEDGKQIQLTWQSNKWSKIVVIGKDQKGNSVIEKETLIKWDL